MAYKGVIRYSAGCRKHPRFNPGQGEGAIRGGCPVCQRLLDMQEEVFAFKRRLVAMSEQIAEGVVPERKVA